MTDPAVMKATGRDLFTQTRLRAFRKCPRYHYLRFEVGLVEAETRKALRMGSAFHLGQEELAKIAPGADEAEREKLVDAAILAALVDYNEAPPHGVEPLDWAIERETVGRLLQGYASRSSTLPGCSRTRSRP